MTQAMFPAILNGRALKGPGYRVSGSNRHLRTGLPSNRGPEGAFETVPEDNAILQRVARREDGSTEEMISHFGNLVWAIVRKFSFDDAESEDAAQEIFIEIWKHAPRFDPELAKSATFVAMIARRRMIDRIRRQKTRITTSQSSDPQDPVDGRTATKSESLVDETNDTLRAFSRLRPEHQQVLKLSIHHGQTHEQIALTTGLPLGTVKTHARRGLMQLRELLNPAMEPSSSPVAGGAS